MLHRSTLPDPPAQMHRHIEPQRRRVHDAHIVAMRALPAATRAPPPPPAAPTLARLRSDPLPGHGRRPRADGASRARAPVLVARPLAADRRRRFDGPRKAGKAAARPRGPPSPARPAPPPRPPTTTARAPPPRPPPPSTAVVSVLVAAAGAGSLVRRDAHLRGRVRRRIAARLRPRLRRRVEQPAHCAAAPGAGRADATDGRRRSSEGARPAPAGAVACSCCALLPSPLSGPASFPAAAAASAGDDGGECSGGGGGALVGSAGGCTGGGCSDGEGVGGCTGDRWSGDVSCASECDGALSAPSPPTAAALCCSPSPFFPAGGSPASLAYDGLRARSSSAAPARSARSASIFALALAAWFSASMYVVYLKISVCR